MSVKTRVEIKQDANDLIPDNTSNLVTPEDVRQRIIDLADSSVSKKGDSGIQAKLSYTGTIVFSNDNDIVNKKYVDDSIADVDLSGYIKADGTVAFVANQSMGGFSLTDIDSLYDTGGNVSVYVDLRQLGYSDGTTYAVDWSTQTDGFKVNSKLAPKWTKFKTSNLSDDRLFELPDYDFIFPTSAPSAGDVLGYDGVDYVWTAGGGGSVNSVSGTTDRITISGTASDPIVDISASYAGQNTIVTLGTITTGVWNAGALTTSGDLTMSSAKGIKDANGNYVIVLPSTVASAVNYFTVSNSATGGDVSITATGSDTNINILYSTKGTGVHRFNAAIHLFNGTSYVEALRAATTTLNFGAGFSAISFSVTTTFAGISSSAGAILTGGNFLTGTAGNIYMNNGTSGGTGLGQRVIHMYNGTAPAPSVTTDRHQYYSADIVAGNAAPHFLTEAGDLIKLYSVSGWGTPTGTLTRTTFDSGTVTLPQLAERVAALISDLKTGHGLLKA